MSKIVSECNNNGHLTPENCQRNEKIVSVCNNNGHLTPENCQRNEKMQYILLLSKVSCIMRYGV